MGLPINTKLSQAGCQPIASTCVKWTGPSLDCIDLCTGDTIDDVTAKLAQELCDIIEQLDIAGFDLSCFNPICPTPTNFHDLVQFIIDKLCEQQTSINTINTDCCGGGAGLRARAGEDCPDCLVDIAPCFYFNNEFGDTITQLLLSDYARAIGTKVCTIVSQIASIQTTLSQQQTQITDIQNQVNALPVPVPLPTFLTTCLTDKIPSIPADGVAIKTMVDAIQDAFCELRTATGMPNDILSAILKQCIALDSSAALNLPGQTMSSISGWVSAGSYKTLADSINNQWLAICDLRAAVGTILNTCCPKGCDGLILDLQVVFNNPVISFYWAGDATGFTDCNPAGSVVTITDAYGNYYTTRIPIVAYVNGVYNLNVGSTPLNLATNLSIKVDACFINSNGDTCQRCIESTIVNLINCPSLSLSADATTVIYQFNNTFTGTITYDIVLKQGATVISTQSTTTSSAGSITGTFDSLNPGTIYTVSIIVEINGSITNTCPVGVITTEDLNCNPPTEVSAEAVTA